MAGDVFDSGGPLTYLADLLTNLQGPDGTLLQGVAIGAPGNFADQVSAYVALGEQIVGDFTLKVLRRDAAFYIAFAYRVGASQTPAEFTLAAILDALVTAHASDRTLGGTANTSSIDLSLTRTPTYQKVEQHEFRVYAVTITARQYQER